MLHKSCKDFEAELQDWNRWLSDANKRIAELEAEVQRLTDLNRRNVEYGQKLMDRRDNLETVAMQMAQAIEWMNQVTTFAARVDQVTEVGLEALTAWEKVKS